MRRKLSRQPRLGVRRPGLNSAAAAKLLQSCLTLCNPVDSSPPGSPVPGILQKSMEWEGRQKPQCYFYKYGIMNPGLH